QVIGIDASATLDKTRDQVKRIANNAAELIGLGREITDADVDIRSGWEGPAYGIPDEATVNAIRTTAELEGVILDPVYEGKSMAGLLDLVGSGTVAKDSTVLYAHLGGQLALNAYSSIF
ncbi:MAG: pyridoxal-phosphate dependent enzyme, partial [Brevibacterium aurantiacum]